MYQHFRKDEHPFIDQVMSWRTKVEKQFQLKLTDFLDPREQDIIKTLVGTDYDDLQLELYGGHRYAEQKRAIIAPFYETISNEDFEVVLLQASFPEQFVSLSHRDVLGAFLSLGLKRHKLGDIIVGDGQFQMVVTADISPFVTAQLTKVKHAKIQLHEKPFADVLQKQQDWIEHHHVVSSLRLDVVLKEIYNLSRSKSADYIKSGLVKVNFKQVDHVAFLLQEGDMISVRGKGRSKLMTVNGQTKKEKWKINTALLQS
ncbi:RNA-binding protein [Lentibacillus saliphilus]|uniref:YlmH family RNA-binding protein n=1 Tax=Lentibacillus saliphilus TaxID=2737028 RepID=UPI0031BB8697